MYTRSVVTLALLGALAGTAAADDRLRINGYGSLEYEKQIFDLAGKGDKQGSFDADGFDLVVTAVPTDRFRVSADVSWEHGASTEEFRGNVVVEYAFAELYAYDWLKVRAGKTFTPFGIYNEIHTAKPLFLSVKEPQSTNKIDKMGSTLRFYPRWGAGLSLLGNGQISGKEWDYTLQISNGEQRVAVATDPKYPNPFEEDDNSFKALAARVRFHPVTPVTLGFSVYNDHLAEYDKAFKRTGHFTALRSYGFQAAYEKGRVGGEVEYIYGYYKPGTTARVARHGLSAMAWGNLGLLRPYLRYEAHDPDHDKLDDSASTVLGGINVRVQRGLFLKLEVDRFMGDLKNPRFKGVDSTEFKASVSFGF
jgi:hypothetical protein